MITNLIIKYIFRKNEEIVCFLGTEMQSKSLFAVIRTRDVWEEETIITKIKCLVNLEWIPNQLIISKIAKSIFMNEIFGQKSDFGNELFKLMQWHNSRKWILNDINEMDLLRANSLETLSVLTHQRLKNKYDNLNLSLGEQFYPICILTYPMVIKIPVISFHYFLNIHSSFTFNSIRKSKHPHAEDIISYLYDLLFLQQKIAISIYEFHRLIEFSEKNKNDALMINAEMDAIICADTVFTYLKASIEKTIIVLGLNHQINNLDSKKTHKSKIDSLIKNLPENLKELDYFKFVMEYISSDNLTDLNNYRSGLLHKKGISDLQPHNYVGEKAETLPLKKIFQILKEQHTSNTAVLIAVLAMLTDELVKLDPPEISMNELPNPFFNM